eukprot:TRINITY_DN2655_c0_g1_i1.p4 TRINITY_DN2655_c0_g1~~TRINITY_DN2655_c0_g1_i1.p4  ORF type:complete len:113 (+),score=12.63 TRINITY_DN2655_c0_g1_i1:783-1121(+)
MFINCFLNSHFLSIPIASFSLTRCLSVSRLIVLLIAMEQLRSNDITIDNAICHIRFTITPLTIGRDQVPYKIVSLFLNSKSSTLCIQSLHMMKRTDKMHIQQQQLQLFYFYY